MAKTFTVPDVEVYTFIDVELTEEDLRAYGWVRADEGLPFYELENWHNSTHSGPLAWCQEEPCYQIVRHS